MGNRHKQFLYDTAPDILIPDLQQDLKENFFKGIWGLHPAGIQVKIPGRLFTTLYEPVNRLREQVSREFGYPRRSFRIIPYPRPTVELSIQH